jgi:hypothetical protein
MDDTVQQPTPSPKPPAPLQDALKTWTAETGAAGAPDLTVLRLDASDRLVIPFTTTMARVTLHYLDASAYRGYLHCQGPDCLLCRIGRQAEVRDLLPVYDPVAQAVGVLAVSPNVRPHALRPQLAAVLRRLDEGRPLLVTIRRLDTARFGVGTLPLPEGADDGAARILEFTRRFESGAVDLGAVYPSLTREELMAIPEVAGALRLRGVTAP